MNYLVLFLGFATILMGFWSQEMELKKAQFDAKEWKEISDKFKAASEAGLKASKLANQNTEDWKRIANEALAQLENK